MADIKSKIKDIRIQNSLSRKAFADKLGFTEAKIQNIEDGRQRIDHVFLQALMVKFDIDIENLLTDTDTVGSNSVNNIKFITIPRWSAEASAGAGAEAEGESITGEYAFSQRWLTKRGLNPNALAVISVTGDSMEPDLYDGDLILIDHSETAIKDSKVYAIRFSDGLFVKRIQQKPNSRISLLSSNKFYDPIEIKYPAADSIQVVGRVVASMHEW